MTAANPPSGTGGDDVSVLSWLQTVADQNVPDDVGPVIVPVAFVGRTSDEEAQDPTLSLPRQLDSCRRRLPDGFLIVAHFYDVESGRKAAELRGHGHGHEQFNIPIPRDGGMADLLAEAKRPDRRFVAVVCESIDRISRITYVGTKIEYELERAGVALLAADEGIDPSAIPGLGGGGAAPFKKATPTLTRRVKQAIAEWYVLNMLELSWGGFKAHTDQGWNVGKPPFGYLAERHKHPVRAKAHDGKVKHRLVPDPDRGPVVTQIFVWRALERLSYRAIADRLNTDLDRYPPPQPILGTNRRAVGAWTIGSVRDVLANPKYTGYMVWNRRKNPRKERQVAGRVNPPSQWVWSRQPTHEPLVTRALFDAATPVGRYRRGSRPEPGPSRHPQTRRSYLLRSYLHCDLCGRRMFGNQRKHYTYYRCRTDAANHAHQPWFDRHPKDIFVREDQLIDPIARFFAGRVFGSSRKLLLADAAPVADTRAEVHRRTLRAEIADLARAQDNLLTQLERYQPTGDPDIDDEWRMSLQRRFAAVVAERRAKTTRLTELDHNDDQAGPGDSDLIDALPQAEIDITRLPEEQQRLLYDAFHLQVRYHEPSNAVILRITLDAETAPVLAQMIQKIADADGKPIADETQKSGAGVQTPAPDHVWPVRSAPGGTRTHTVGGLSSVSLPVGVQGPGRL